MHKTSLVEQEMITALDLKSGEKKGVVYTNDKCTIIVPDDSWSMDGDLSGLPKNMQSQLEHYSKNGFTKKQAVIYNGSQSLNVPNGTKALSGITQHGYSMVSARVVFLGEFDARGNKL